MHAATANESQTLLAGSLVGGQFLVQRLCHVSSSSALYAVSHSALGYQAMLKVLKQRSQQAAVAESRALGLLNHPGAPRLLCHGKLPAAQGGYPFIVREYAPGQPLSALIRTRRRLEPLRTVAIGISVLGVLRAAHQSDILHGDIKPDNIIVKRTGALDRTKLIDFGASRSGIEKSTGTSGVRVFATPQYAAPEVLRGMPPDARADLYSLGMVLYECLCGARPEPGGAPGSGDGQRELLRVDKVVPTSEALANAVAKALASDPEQRYQTADEMLHALESLGCAELAAYPALAGDAPAQEQETLDTVDVTKQPAQGAQEGLARAPVRNDYFQLLSTETPTVWVLSGDPGTDQPAINGVILAATARYNVRVLDADARSGVLPRLQSGNCTAPWVLVFGDLHVLLEDELLRALCTTGETSRLLVSTHGNFELLSSTVNSCGLHAQACLPVAPADLHDQLERMVTRARTVRQGYDRLRLALRDARDDIEVLRRKLASTERTGTRP